MGMDPGFHRGDDKAGKTDGAVDFQSTFSKTLGFEARDVYYRLTAKFDLLYVLGRSDFV